MKKVVAFVDGFNVYYSMQESQGSSLHKYKWLNLRALLNRYIFPKDEQLEDIYYFTALTNNDEKRKRHLLYINALRSENIQTITGYLRYDPLQCPHCKKLFTRPIEKQTDANIISRALTMTARDEFDVALIVSADSDLVPLVKAARALKPYKQFRVIIPIHQKAKELTQVCGERRKMSVEHVANSQFADIVTLQDGMTVQRPNEWR